MYIGSYIVGYRRTEFEQFEFPVYDVILFKELRSWVHSTEIPKLANCLKIEA